MNHAVPVIVNFTCQHFGISQRMLKSSNRDLKYRDIRQKIILLAGYKKDDILADMLNRSKEDIRGLRRGALGNMQFDRKLQNEIETLKRELLKYEIS